MLSPYLILVFYRYKTALNSPVKAFVGIKIPTYTVLLLFDADRNKCLKDAIKFAEYCHKSNS